MARRSSGHTHSWRHLPHLSFSSREKVGFNYRRIRAKRASHVPVGMSRAIVFGAVLLLLHSVALAGPPVVKAKVEEPVLPELMGGCSLRCAFPWSVEAQQSAGQKPVPVKMLNDENPDTAWIAAFGSSGVGAKVQLSFPSKLPKEEEGQVPIYGIDFINGAWSPEGEWKKRGRVKRLRLTYNATPLVEVILADSRRWQRVTFPDTMIHSGDRITVEILEVYPGEKGAGAALTEIVLQGAH